MAHRKLTSGKLVQATGPDEIPNWVHKCYAPALAGPICSIFNASIAQGVIPSLWKCADVIPVPKVPKPKSVDSDLRPISLTPVLSKVLEHFVSRWLLQVIEPYIDILQFGNTRNCSTTHALIHLIHNWLAALDSPQGKSIRACMIDFSKAFDRIDHNILLLKLQIFGVPPILLNWCADFLQARNLRVKMGQIKSSWHQINGSVPQGTKLGPIFFLVMINDLESILPIYKVVDDCTVYEVLPKSAISALQTNIDGISEWIHNNNMLLNVKKTKELRISFTKFPLDLQNLLSANSEIKVVDEFKLLGVTISSDLSWNSHINDICSKASKRLYALRVLRRSGAPPKDLITVYCAFIRPVLEYACQVWHFSLPKYLCDQIESIQGRALKIALPDVSYQEALMYTNLETLEHRRQHQCQKLYTKILNQENNKLKELLPAPKQHRYSFRITRKFDIFKCRTERFKKSFIPSCVNTWDNLTI